MQMKIQKISFFLWGLAKFQTSICQQGCGAGASEPGIVPGAGVGAQIKNQELELSLKFRIGAGAAAIWEVAPAPGPFLGTNGFAALP